MPSSVEMPAIGVTGRCAAILRAVNPLDVRHTISGASIISAAIPVVNAMASAVEWGRTREAGASLRRRRGAPDPTVERSISSMMLAMARTASTGYSPMAVSAESMTASVPSRMALATSDASARVGRGLCTMDSSIWVAVITGRARRLARAMRRFWASGTSS